jgi:hypothetical protein
MKTPAYQIPDQHLDIIVRALQSQPWVQVNATIQMLLAQANSPENQATRPKVQEEPKPAPVGPVAEPPPPIQ